MGKKAQNDRAVQDVEGGKVDRNGFQSLPQVETTKIQSDAFLAALVESSDDAIVSKDLNGVITSWNRGAERMFGYNAAEVIGRPVTILIPPDQADEEPRILERIRRGERIEHYETVRQRKNGSKLNVSLTVSPIKDRNGKVIGASKIARDISERHRVRDRLRQSEERFHVTLASIGDGVISTDNEARVTFMNSVAEELTGWTCQEALGVPLDELFRIFNENTRQPVENPVARVLREGVVVGLGNHTFLLSKDGKERPIDDSAAPIRGRDGDLIGVVLVFRDATKQRTAELALRKLAAIVESSDDAIVSKTPDGIIQSWNRGAERIFGYSEREAIGKPITMLIPQDRLSEETEFMRRLRSGERIDHCETVRITKDGRKIDVSLTISPIRDEAGHLIGASKILRDITNRKRTEDAAREAGDRYRALFNSMDQGFCIIEVIFDESLHPQDYRFLEINPAFEKQTGIKNALGKTMGEMVPDREKEWCEIYSKVALSGEPIRFQKWSNALNRWFDVYAFRVGQSPKREVAVLFTDITERKKSEQTLAKTKKDLENYASNLEAMVAQRTAKLQQTVADLEAFSFTVSHDLRSPLRSMQGFAQAVLEEYADKLDDQGREYLQRISNSAVRLDNLIREVLTYSRIGRGELAIESIDLEGLVDETIETYPSIQKSHAEIIIVRPLLPVLGSRASLVQCVSNLLANAVKFVPGGAKVRIRVWTENVDSKVRLFVEDNGIGIPANLLTRIFEPFQRGHPHAGYEGTGMGLAIVQKAMHRMGGDVGVKSEVGKGSTFWIELPAAKSS
jgi:PAS domain S-box-containing protein